MSRFNSILIANRGEIACRVIRSAKALGYRTIAVYSEADSNALHVQMADDAVCIGAGPVNESYLLAERILDAARQTGAQAIHPGYGFLSENADFAQACVDAGIIFIGPSAEAINLMGNKAEAKRRMIQADVPCVPGYEGVDQSDDTLLREAGKIDLPMMVKAAAGGGGRGMRLVHNREELADTLQLARAEALSAFGSDELILEQAIIRPRHVEVQVFADSQGNTVHLGERDCSVQRRHQKVVEEAPCPIMTDALRERMGAAAVAAAKSINYQGAGTVEFLLAENGAFYFLEMNTRLQVEHPVTELITGLDLVALQIQVAQGEPLGLTQEDIKLQGHAIEVRLYAEDTSQDFLPTSGPIHLWSPPQGEGIRVDHGIRSGQEVSPYYDPMIAKVITSGPSREVARLRMIEALNQTLLFGTRTNRDFLKACIENEVFIEGAATTAFIGEEFSPEQLEQRPPSFCNNAIAAVIELQLQHQQAFASSVNVAAGLKNWSSSTPMPSRKRYQHGEKALDLWITPDDEDTYIVTDEGDHTCTVNVISINDGIAKLSVDGRRVKACFQKTADKLYLSEGGVSSVYRDEIPFDGLQDQTAGGGNIIAPMHGQLLELKVQTGDSVEAGQTLAILEAMKMFYELTAETAGTVTDILVEAGTQVAADELLIQVEAAE
ncbi:acetyl/propionyl/methylcrotonyl-CoA carboxylase subunit alpha [Pseudomaricurvus alkylphenolicus]|uniref:acetyl/propionyl/methylcrotonyl-CoA carboxylase subunit alpha n=1 Tax=Pseudomaricurvus alkylphenolicus TaxID=1306991 RepID=UPI001420260A|nr:acetyl/propionyl/methylcrotonyl-CoA carboxylase subunit alpha [Pseudomaricurvus alkylphenolicus]NIB38161.1 acetyl/propionyl/methylcrotonyl-CoA carboxylase subunit alpha [Pseudomaricurvus alkylphenolicus]